MDAPPQNRFVKRSLSKKGIAAIAAVVIVISVFGLESSRIFGKPSITIRYPHQNPAIATYNNITLEGTVTLGSKIYINGESVEVATDGLWKKTIVLGSGMNPVEIKAKKFLGSETTILQQILYETPTTSFNANPHVSGI